MPSERAKFMKEVIDKYNREFIEPVGVLLMTSLPNQETLEDSNIPSNQTYIRVQGGEGNYNALFYINKATKECVKIDTDHLSVFDKVAKPKKEFQYIPLDRLDEIGSLTDQTHGKIEFVHGGSSAPFTIMGKSATIRKFDKKNQFTQETVQVPQALIPTGQLRKKYGLYPIVGELSIGTFGHTGKRRQGVNYGAISGIDPNKLHGAGLEVAANYSNLGQRKITADVLYENMEYTILTIRKNNYVEALKRLEMLAQNYMVMGGGLSKSQVATFLSYLTNEKEILLLQAKDNPNEIQKITHYFDKYSKIISDKLSNITVTLVEPNQNLIHSIENKYPVIFCCTVKGASFGQISGEKMYVGDINLDEIKMLFVDEAHKNDLVQKLMTLGYQDKIQVNVLPPKPKEIFTIPKSIEEFQETIMAIEEESRKAALQICEEEDEIVNEAILQKGKNYCEGKNLDAVDISEVQEAIVHDYVYEWLRQYCNDFFNKLDFNKNSFALISYIFEKYNFFYVDNILSSYKILYDPIAVKIESDPNYLEKAPNASQEKMYRLEKIYYFKAMSEILKKVKEGLVTWPIKNDIDFPQLFEDKKEGTTGSMGFFKQQFMSEFEKFEFLCNLWTFISGDSKDYNNLKNQIISAAEKLLDNTTLLEKVMKNRKETFLLNNLFIHTAYCKKLTEKEEIVSEMYELNKKLGDF